MDIDMHGPGWPLALSPDSPPHKHQNAYKQHCVYEKAWKQGWTVTWYVQREVYQLELQTERNDTLWCTDQVKNASGFLNTVHL